MASPGLLRPNSSNSLLLPLTDELHPREAKPSPAHAITASSDDLKNDLEIPNPAWSSVALWICG
jgi:hypothetical protein